jgi:GT2 family glycosyltransferase
MRTSILPERTAVNTPSELTVILPTYNRRHVLERTIGFYLALAERYPVIVIDDGSHDGTAAWISSLPRGNLRLIALPHNQGLPHARNIGVAAALTPWVLFGEDDVLMSEAYPHALLAAARLLPRVAAVAGNLYDGTDWTLPQERPASTAAPLLDLARCGANFGAHISAPMMAPSLHACALINRTAALAVGGYDRQFTGSAFREESDFYARLWRAGHACWLTPDAWAIHVRHRLGGGCRGSATIAAKVRNRLSSWRNNNRYLERHSRLWRHWGCQLSETRLKRDFARSLLAQSVSATLQRRVR